jgi:predicted RecB family nuclease
MCHYYRRHDCDLEREAREVTESKLMEEQARHRQEQHERRMAEREKPLTEKVKEMVGARQ